MLMYKKNQIVKINSGKLVKVINLPTSFMSNGSYEVIEWIDNGIGEIGNPFWIKPEEIMYQVNQEVMDDINNYFEIIWDDNGLNLIPKDIFSVDIESDREDFNRIKFNYDDGRKHNTVNIHIGDIKINDKNELTIKTVKEKKSKLEKVINILKENET